MKQFPVALILAVLVFALGTPCLAQTPPAQPIASYTPADAVPPGGTVRGDRSSTKPSVGKVVAVHLEAKTLTVQLGTGNVTFDLSNPTLEGFKGVGDIKPGVLVSIGYTRAGVKMSKGFGKGVSPQHPVKAKGDKRQRVAQRLPRNDFTGCDVNEDGKISPVELSMIMPGLTMSQFRTHDKNGDGCLDKSEFEALEKP